MKNRRTSQFTFKVAFGPLFPTANDFSWVGMSFIQETDYKKPNPTKFSANTLSILVLLLVRTSPGMRLGGNQQQKKNVSQMVSRRETPH